MKIKKFLYGIVMSFALLWVMFSATDVNAVRTFDYLYGEANKSLTSVVVSWTKQYGVEKYVILQKKGGKYKKIKTVGNDVDSCTVNNLKKNKEYYFQVLGYTKKNGKYTLSYKDTTSVFTVLNTKWIPVEAKMKSLTTVKLTWKKCSDVKKWVIRQKIGYSYKTIKTVKKNIKTYTVKHLKKNKMYKFEVLGFIKKGGKYVLKYSAFDYGITGIAKPVLDRDPLQDYEYTPPDHSPSYIKVRVAVYSGYPTKGLEIWRRKKGSSKYKKIKTLKAEGDYSPNYEKYLYKDTDVEAGGYYYYKCRAFGTYKKKKTYSAFSTPWLGMALYDEGIYDEGIYDVTLNEVKDKSFTLSIKSNKYNTDLTMKEDISFIFSKLDGENAFSGTATEWCVNGVWRKAQKSKDITIKPGQTVLMRISSEKNIPDDISAGYSTEENKVIYRYEANDDYFDHAIFGFTINGEGTAGFDSMYYYG